MTLTIGDRLDNYEKRYGWNLTASKIAEPWVRLQYWARAVRRAYAVMCGLGHDPSHELDAASDDYHYALGQWQAEAAHIKATRDIPT